MRAAWLDSLDDNALVLTGTSLLAAELRQRYAAGRIQRGQRTWETPDILPLASWISREWRDIQIASEAAPLLLSATQERIIWQQCIEADSRTQERSILQVRAAARHAAAASQLLTAWRLALSDSLLDEDARAFRDWSAQFHERLSDRHWITQAGATDVLIDNVAARSLAVPARVLLCGFDQLSPQIGALMLALRDTGVEVERIDIGAERGRAVAVEFADVEDELEAAARWAVCWSRRARSDGADGPIGVVVPDLERSHRSVARFFDEVFAAAGAGPDAAYTLAVSPPLHEAPAVGDALALLRLSERTIPLASIERLLRSPYVAGAGRELAVRSRAVASIRSLAEDELALVTVLRQLHTYCPETALIGRLDGFYQSLLGQPRRQPAGEWALTFSRQLRGLGWPGDCALTDAEQASVRAFEDLLDDLAAVSLVVPALSARQALGQLRSLAAERRLASPRQSAPVRILPAAGSAGFELSALWVTGLHDGAWPPAPRPNPFIPARLQREAHLPRSTAAWQLDWAERTTARWLSASAETVLSFASAHGGRDRSASPLIDAIERVSIEALETVDVKTGYQRLRGAALELESFVDAVAPPLTPGTGVGGGVGVIKAQAACPFRAFGLYRLGATGLDEAGAGLDPKTRGSLLHEVLDGVWSALRSQAELLTMTAGQVEQLVDESVSSAFDVWRTRRPHTLRGRFERIEIARHKTLVMKWLEVEKQRSPFDVQRSEFERTADIGGLPIGIRPDRLDRVGDGLLVIDYKTGNARVADWLDERIDEPQLPIYCTAIDDLNGLPVIGAAFASVGSAAVRYQGLSEVHSLAPGIETFESSPGNKLAGLTSWSDLKQRWRQRLERLAADFLSGDARVLPKGATTCRNCELKSLCRIHERNDAFELEDDR